MNNKEEMILTLNFTSVKQAVVETSNTANKINALPLLRSGKRDDCELSPSVLQIISSKPFAFFICVSNANVERGLTVDTY